MTDDLEQLVAKTKNADATLLASVEAWAPDEAFNALLMQSYSSKNLDSIQELRKQVFQSFYTDDLILDHQKLNTMAGELSIEDYRLYLSMGLSAENSVLVQAVFQKKLQESLTMLMAG